MIRILIVDDQNLVREGIKVLLEKTDEIEIVADANNGKSALEKIEILRPDVVLLDIDMPGIDGLTVAEQVRGKFPQTEIIMLSSHQEPSYIERATASGAKGYLFKDATSQELEWSIKLVSQGYSAIKSNSLGKIEPKSGSSFSHRTTIIPLEEAIGDSSYATSSTQYTVARDAESARLERVLAENQIRQKYLASRQQRSRKYLFHSANLTKMKKTVASFEFRLLVFIIIFSLGFLVFVALS